MRYDLHLHSKCSDGKYTRLELLRYFNENHYDVVSFTDHNYIDNVDLNLEYYKKYKQIQQVSIINGIEFDVFENSRLHILGYGITDIERVQENLFDIRRINTEISKKIISNIYQKYKIKIPIDTLLSLSVDQNISKSDIVNWLIQNGYAKDYKEAGYLYTSEYSPCYEKRYSLKMEEVISLINKCGGIPVFAHPYSTGYSDSDLYRLILEMVDYGLQGIEVNNTDKTNAKQVLYLKKICNELNLLKSCGSDFHNEDSTPRIGLNDDESNEMIKKLR